MPSSKISFYKNIIFLTISLIVAPASSTASLVGSEVINKIALSKHTKTQIPLGKYTIYLNHTIEEFKESMFEKARNIKNDSDEFYKFLGLRTESQTQINNLNTYFSDPGFAQVETAPAFAMSKVNVIFLNTDRIEGNTDFNIKSRYDTLRSSIDDIQSIIQNTSSNPPKQTTIYPTPNDFSQYLDSLHSDILLSLTTEQLIKNFESIYPPKLSTTTKHPNLNTEDLEDKLTTINSSISSITDIFKNWSWFLNQTSGSTPLTLQEISQNNTGLDWVYLHELSHLSKAQQKLKDDHYFLSKSKTRLLREMNSDLFAAIMLNYKDKQIMYKKIDSMMFARILKYQDTSHFTLVPLMVMKTLMKYPGYIAVNSHSRKEIVIQKIIKATVPYLDDIMTTNSDMTKFNHEYAAHQFKKYVFSILKDLAPAPSPV
jgi:hypothetical protein